MHACSSRNVRRITRGTRMQLPSQSLRQRHGDKKVVSGQRGGREREGQRETMPQQQQNESEKQCLKPAKSPLWAASWPTLMAGPGRVNASVAAPSASRRKTWRARWQCRTGCIGCSPPACMSTWIMYQCICMHVYANTRASARTHEHIGVGDCNVPIMAAGLTRAR